MQDLHLDFMFVVLLQHGSIVTWREGLWSLLEVDNFIFYRVARLRGFEEAVRALLEDL
jgi:hypothetical protein